MDIDDECRLDLDDLERQLTDRTKVVAFPVASNAVGTRPEQAIAIRNGTAAHNVKSTMASVTANSEETVVSPTRTSAAHVN